MSLETIRTSLPDWAKDIKLNLGTILVEEVLTPQQLWGCIVACTVASRVKPLADAAIKDAQNYVTDEALQAAKSAAAIMSMNNVYYRTMHLSRIDALRAMPPRLRMGVIATSGIDKADFELMSLAVSAMAGCGMCIEAHEHELIKAGMPLQSIQTAIRIAAVLNAVATIVRVQDSAA